jgi:hypothetical protein
MSGQVFISYRRDDSEGYAGRLYDRLSVHFGDERIFMDVDTIEPGVDFVQEIEKAVNSCDVLPALIGPLWLTATDKQGKLRLENPEDFVRLEIAAALERGIRVIPVLVQGASMPQSLALPENLRPLARRNAIELSHSRFSTDVDRVIRAIERAIEAADKDLFTSERKSGEGEKLGELNVEQVGDSLTEILSETLSIETLGGIATPIIERGTPIPIRKSMIFSTAADGQTSVEIHLLKGERSMAADNISLAKFILDGIPPAPRGLPQIEVTFDVDANGILKASAQDKATGRMQHITAKATSGLSNSEIERIRNEAKQFADEDRKRKELAEARNKANNVVSTAQKTLKDFGDKMADHIRTQVAAKVAEIRSILEDENSDIETITRVTDELSDELSQAVIQMEKVANQQRKNEQQSIRRWQTTRDFSDLFGSGNFSDFFDSIFGTTPNDD